MNNVYPPPTDVVLRPFGREDFDRLISWVPSAAAQLEWCGGFFRFPLDHAQLEAYLKSAGQPNVRAIFTAMLGGRAVGHVEVSHIWPHLSSRLSRVLVAPAERRRGIGARMLGHALADTFTEHRVHHVDLGVPTDNAPAIACYRKLGFVLIDTWPAAIAGEGGSLDVDWMRLTRTTWAAQTRKDLANRSRPA